MHPGALACLRAARAELEGPIGLFGHSQGGWVVVEAASRSPAVAFAMTSSAPGVTPAEQEHYAAAAQLERSGASATQVAAGLRHFDLLAQLARDRAPFEEARRRASSADTAGELDSPFVPDDEDVWNFICAGLDYDPRAALERITVPLLALFGSDDPILPVAESVEVYRAAVPTDLLRIEVFPGADHRLEVGEPPRLADGYLETVSSFVSSAVDRT